MEKNNESMSSKTVDLNTQQREGAPTTHHEFDKLVRTIWRLRQPDGCPWDKVQTHSTICNNFIEEAYEAVEAIGEQNQEHLREELGDVLMQVLLHAQIEADDGGFTIDDVCHELNEKLVRRHPHVFGNVQAQDAESALARWDSVKQQERITNTTAQETKGLLESIPKSLPALMQCQKISKRAAKAGFEWETLEDVWEKVDEEKQEFLAEKPHTQARTEEFGDLLFALVNVARWEGIDAEEALAAANAKFRRRWKAVETLCLEQSINLESCDVDELNAIWNHVKGEES